MEEVTTTTIEKITERKDVNIYRFTLTDGRTIDVEADNKTEAKSKIEASLDLSNLNSNF